MIKLIKKIVPLESEEAKKFWQWGQYHPIVRDHLLHIANEQKTSWANGKKLKSEGRRKGVSDYFLAYPLKDMGGLWIELKRSDKRLSIITKEQFTWLERMERAGYSIAVCYGADEAIREVEKYLKEE